MEDLHYNKTKRPASGAAKRAGLEYLTRKSESEALMTRLIAILGVGAFVSTIGARGTAGGELPVSSTVTCTHGVVVCVAPAGAEVGRSVLEAGGNSVDAAVATAFAL